MPIGPNTKIRNNAVHPTTEPVDNLSHSDLTQAVDLGGELDAIRSQIKRIIRYDAGGNWYDQQPVFRAQGDTSEFVLQSGVDLKIDDGTIVATGDLALDDGNREGSTWSAPIKLSATAEEWSALESVYDGEKSLIAMLHNAASSSTRTKLSLQVEAISKTSTLFVPDVDWSGDAANYVDVLLNGQLLRGGTSAQVTSGEVDYTIVGQNGINFSFNVPEDDILTFVVMGGDLLGSSAGSGTSSIGGGGPSPATTVVAETSFGLSPAAGSSAKFAREDHTHGTPSIPAHSALTSPSWVGSGHTAVPYTVAIFDVTGSANIVAPPDAGQRQGKFLSWLSDTQIGWTAPAFIGVGLLGGIADMPVVTSNEQVEEYGFIVLGNFSELVSLKGMVEDNALLLLPMGPTESFTVFNTSTGLPYLDSGAVNVSPDDETFNN